MPPSAMKLVLDGIMNNRIWLLTHPEDYRSMIEQRCKGIVDTGELVRGAAI